MIMHSNKNLPTDIQSIDTISSSSNSNTSSSSSDNQNSHFDFNLLTWSSSLLSFVPWFITPNHNDTSTLTTALNISTHDFGTTLELKPTPSLLSTTTSVVTTSTAVTIHKPNKYVPFDLKRFASSLLLLIPWAIHAKDGIRTTTTINKGLKRRAQSRNPGVANGRADGASLRFRPYVSKVPWHTGPRGFLSQLFPRYGHYCGPNWSSGKDNGSPLWDKRPIDWLDYCCYCHDIGYDTHDQAKLLKADLEFLACLERPHMTTKGNTRIALLYKTMCITGLRNFLIPYRTQLVNLQLA